MTGADNGASTTLLDAYGAGAGAGSLIGRYAAGTAAAPAAVIAGNALLNIIGEGRGTSTYAPGAFILMQAAENWSETARGTAIVLQTCAVGSAAQVRRIFLQRGMLMYDAAGGIPTGADQGAGTINLPATGGYYLNGQNITAGHLPGTQTNDNALAGQVGEYIVSTIASPGVSLTNASNANITSISLSPGDWDVTGMVAVAPSATCTAVQAWVNSVSAAPPAPSRSPARTISPCSPR